MRVSKHLLTAMVAAACVACAAATAPAAATGFERFVRRDGDVLKDGAAELRFISFNIPNLHYVEDDMVFDRAMPFRFPDRFEIDDALGTIAQMGGQVVRMYALSVRKASDPPAMPRYILGPGKFNEEAFKVLDEVIAAAHRHRVRVILPFVDQWSWWGGIADLAAFRGKKEDAFWTDPELIADFKNVVAHVVNRVNTVTGVPYREDKAILAWETGNELKAPDSWTALVAAHVKSIDSNHLVIDGAMRRTVSEASLADPNVDFVQTHHYDKDVRDMLDGVLKNARLARGRKPYHVGEFGFLGTEALCAVMDLAIAEKITGAMLWSLRYRSRDGGFYWHHEPYGGDFFKSYHWPGFEIGEKYDERRFMRLARERAFAIRGMTPPPLPAPAAPELIAVTDGAMLTWRGAVGASLYDVERAEAAAGPWASAGVDISEAQVQYRPLFADESARPGASYFYRVIARNAAGASAPSTVLGPVRITHRTLVDELWNDARIFLKEGASKLVENDARKFKEDCHRLAGGAKAAIIYRAAPDIRTVRVFAFSQSGEAAVRISFSSDCRTFRAAAAEAAGAGVQGDDAYGVWNAKRYTAAPAAPGVAYVKIEFLADAQIGRVEIEHDRAE